MYTIQDETLTPSAYSLSWLSRIINLIENVSAMIKVLELKYQHDRPVDFTHSKIRIDDRFSSISVKRLLLMVTSAKDLLQLIRSIRWDNYWYLVMHMKNHAYKDILYKATDVTREWFFKNIAKRHRNESQV
uniref:Uncharacterized protein n=1 Tax=Glossina austeni TaxID=7395 RepID=A0A1A9UT75_GLOAU